MKIDQIFKTLALSFCVMILAVSTAQADSMDELKQQFLERKPAIDQLISQGKIGENNQGYLEEKGSLTDEQKSLINAENNDRKKIYMAIAKKNSSPVDTVSKIRAKAIIEKLDKGAWYQDDAGKWHKK